MNAGFLIKVIENLPLPLGRNYEGLFKELPGFSLPENAHSIPSNPSRAMRFNVNGTSGSSNNIRVDGVTGTNVWLPQTRQALLLRQLRRDHGSGIRFPICHRADVAGTTRGFLRLKCRIGDAP